MDMLSLSMCPTQGSVTLAIRNKLYGMLMAIDESLFWDSVLDAAGIVITGPQMSQ